MNFFAITTIQDLLTVVDKPLAIHHANVLASQNYTSEYESMLDQLDDITPEASGLTVVIKGCPGYVRVYGWYDHHEDDPCAIEYVPWAQWLGARFVVENFDGMSEQIFAHILNEMTDVSFDEETIAEQAMEIEEYMEANLS